MLHIFKGYFAYLSNIIGAHYYSQIEFEYLKFSNLIHYMRHYILSHHVVYHHLKNWSGFFSFFKKNLLVGNIGVYIHETSLGVICLDVILIGHE